jgi:putative ABC transport system permease protein
MHLLVSAGVALRALRVNALRSGLTMLGIIIGVGAVIAMIAVGAGARARVTEQIQSLGSNLLIVSPGTASSGGVRLGYGSRPTITEEDGSAIAREIPGVRAAAPSVWAGSCCRLVYANLNWWTVVQGTVPEYEAIREWPVARGRYFTYDDVEAAGKVAVLGQTVVANLFGKSNPVGEVVRVGQIPFTVVGVLDRKGQNAFGNDQDDVVLVPITTAKKRVIGPEGPRGETVHAITVKVRDGASLKGVERQIRELLRQRHRLEAFHDDDFRVRSLAETLQAEEQSTRVLSILLGAIASVSLLVGGIGIMNIMLVSVTERTREIGIRLAVGARGTDIQTQFLVEAVTLALIGGTIGIALGVSAAYAIGYFAQWRTVIHPESILLAFGFAAAVGIVFGFYPARKAAALNPIDALRYE